MPAVMEGAHIRVEVPLTSDGVNLLYDSEKRVKYKTVYLPLTAKRYIESKSAKLPKHLQYTITTVNGAEEKKPKGKQNG